jgi:hypothetical protein
VRLIRESILLLLGFSTLLPKAQPLFNRAFGHYAIRKRAQALDAITICHGDVNPFNVFFDVKDGKLGSNLRAVIDYQILLYGNPSFDLARFICCSVDGDVRKEGDARSYRIFYDELKRLHDAEGRKMKFSFEQGLELFHLGLCQQATFIVSFLFFIRAMCGQNEATARNFDNLVKRAEYALEQALGYMDKYGLNRSFEK